ncbi:heavy-metal-associated domain-containing protein [Dysgonomonas sp. 216]|uniref:heavy-metal-associated domain-containing protein n=1 Tax=Dysgonomonas sp. 216 TaxID=2302934 RepID=UPI0013D58704|nr:heavy metal-associated domain-containing protein [Dysgonomonas sp. 216]NDW18188.1 heavy-metal-associated domain-containing protein [Dysgonomonas sp. 216]
MKTKILTLVAVLLVAFGSALSAQNKKKKNDKQEVTFEVSMTCENCKKRIEKNIAFEKGVTDLKVDLPEKTVTIEYKENKTDSVKLRKAIEKLGYEVSAYNIKKDDKQEGN